MRPTRDLRRLRRAALARIDRLSETAFDAVTTPLTARQQDQLIAHCVIELHNVWYGFSRSLFLSVCFGTRDSAGSRIPLSKVSPAATLEDALSHAVRRCKTYRYSKGPPWNWIDEPSWVKSSVLLDSLDEIGAGNYALVSAALSTAGVSTTLVHIKDFRHFYAHRGQETRRRASAHALAYALSSQLSPTRILNSHAIVGGSMRPQPVLMDWFDDVRALTGSAI